MFLIFFLNAMIRNIKIHNIFDIIEIQNLCNLNVFIKKFRNIYVSGSYDFSKFDGSKKIKVWHSSGTTQGWDIACEQTIGVHCSCKCSCKHSPRNSSLDKIVILVFYEKNISSIICN